MKTFTRIFFTLFVLLAFFCTAVFVFKPRIVLGPALPAITFLTAAFTGSKATIAGEFFITPGAWTTLEAADVQVVVKQANQEFSEVLIQSARVKVHLFSLLKKKLFFEEIRARKLDVTVQKTARQSDSGEGRSESDALFSSLPFSVKNTGEIHLEDLSIMLADQQANTTSHYELNHITGGLHNTQEGGLKVNGRINGNVIKAEVKVGPLRYLQESALPVSGEVTHKSAKASFNGEVKTSKRGFAVECSLSLRGDHFDDLASIFAMPGSRGIPFNFEGEATLTADEARLVITRLSPVAENVTITVAGVKKQQKFWKYILQLQGEEIDTDGLLQLLRIHHQPQEGGKRKSGNKNKESIIIPLSSIPDYLSLNINLKRLILAGETVANIELAAESSDGGIKNGPFSVEFPSAEITGSFSIAFPSGIPRLGFHFKMPSWDAGPYLQKVNFAEEAEVSIGNVSADGTTSGRTAMELLKNMAFTLTASEGKWIIYRDSDTQFSVPLTIRDVKLTGKPGLQAKLLLQGHINNIPIETETSVKPHGKEFHENISELAIHQVIKHQGTEWAFDSVVPFPFRMEGISVNTRLTGESLSYLNNFIELQLPETAAFDLNGAVKIIEDGYEMSSLKAKLGISSFSGSALFNTEMQPPKITVQFTAKTVQLEDFRPFEKTFSDSSTSEEEKERESNDDVKRYNPFNDRKVLKAFSSEVSVEVDEVYSGKDYLGNGHLTVRQDGGIIVIEPFEISSPKGNVRLQVHRTPVGGNYFYDMSLFGENIDYGIIERWYKPETKAGGILSIRAQLQSVSPDYTQFLANANGYIDFSYQPEQMQAGNIDFWATSLFNLLIPFMESENESKINCFAGKFSLVDGLFKDEDILIDTTKVQIGGDLEINFKNNWIVGYLRPTPKRPQFYNLATPIEINGKLGDLDAGVASGGMVSTVVRLATSHIAVPTQWITRDIIPEDNTEKCLQMVRDRDVKNKDQNRIKKPAVKTVPAQEN